MSPEELAEVWQNYGKEAAEQAASNSMPPHGFVDAAPTFWAIMAASMGAVTLIALVMHIIIAIPLLKIAKKTGFEKKAWWSWVPILNIILMYNLGGYSGWWMICPLGNIIVGIIAWMKISKNCGKPDWLGILMIVSPLNLIIPYYLAFSENDDKVLDTPPSN